MTTNLRKLIVLLLISSSASFRHAPNRPRVSPTIQSTPSGFDIFGRMGALESSVEQLEFKVRDVQSSIELLDEKLDAKFVNLERLVMQLDAKIGKSIERLDAKIGKSIERMDSKFTKIDARFDAMDTKV